MPFEGGGGQTGVPTSMGLGFSGGVVSSNLESKVSFVGCFFFISAGIFSFFGELINGL